MITIHFLCKYPDEADQTGIFQWSIRTIRDKKWRLAQSIQFLKHKKIEWLQEWERHPKTAQYGDIPVFFVSVDGVHCEIDEPSHRSWSKKPKYYSHKFKKAGLAHEKA